jgi:metallophosphoesterase superfamily enzyme
VRTLIPSDLHLGPDSEFNTFAGRRALPKALESLTDVQSLTADGPLHVIVNGEGSTF